LFPHGLDRGIFVYRYRSWRDVFALLAVIGMCTARWWRWCRRIQVCYRLLQREPHGICAAGPGDAEPDRHDGRGAADVLAWIIAGLLFAIVDGLCMSARIRGSWRNWRRCIFRDGCLLRRGRLCAGMASMGCRVLRFVAELQVLIGAWSVKPWWVAAAA